jgi:predicted AAA+ superfamily ATPase
MKDVLGIEQFEITREEIKKRLIVDPHFDLIDKQYIKENMILEMTNYIYFMTKQEADITKTFDIVIDHPKFTDWLFKKQRTITISKVFKLTAKDVLLDPPIKFSNQETIRLFTYDPINFAKEYFKDEKENK